MTPRRCEHLRPLELSRQFTALLPRQQLLQTGHILVRLVLDMGMQVREELVE